MSDLISRQAAIDAFDGVKVDEKTEYDIGYNDGIDLAVSKLSVLPSAEPEPFMVTMDHELTKDEVERLKQSMSNTPIVLFPSVQPEIVRCKDCKFGVYEKGRGIYHTRCEMLEFLFQDDDYCSYGERKGKK